MLGTGCAFGSPGVLEGHDLGAGAGAVLFGEEHVVVLAAVEGWVAVDEVDGLVLDVLAQDFEVVAVIELVFLHCGKILTRIGRLRNCRSVCGVGTPWGIIVARAKAGPSTA